MQFMDLGRIFLTVQVNPPSNINRYPIIKNLKNESSIVIRLKAF